ncbi:MAG TPA: hypothetical protein VNJ08_03665 [Bacteriovoracaceae bacterium]|nr:hypothetical protein [Bacteriovoracaceae bacterium]
MKVFLAFVLCWSYNAIALEAVVTVLETPMFREKRLDSPVVQYLRKGDIIKVHPALGNTTQFDHMAPSSEKYEQLKKHLAQMPEWQDPLFNGKKEEIVYLEDQFIPTLDRQGNTVYVLSEHIYVYFNDSRELVQKVAAKDPTDYRLEEPLPKNYPLHNPTGHRGQILIGFSQAYNESYVYPEPVKTKSYSTPIHVNLGLMWQVPYDKQDRFYFGSNINFKSFQNSYSFMDFRRAKEHYIQFGIGPQLAYDAYKGEKDRLNLSVAINFNPVNYLTVSQSLGTIDDTRIYRGMNVSSRVGMQYHRKKVIEDMDLVLGTAFDIESPTTYQAQNGGSQANWWQNLGRDKYTTRSLFSLTGFMGIQVAY